VNAITSPLFSSPSNAEVRHFFVARLADLDESARSGLQRSGVR
jgi:hypothetical protein